MADKLSQDDIDRLLAGNASPQPEAQSGGNLEYLSEMEADTLGEIGNIFMGSAATTLSLLLGQKVDITTPRVREHTQVQEFFDLSKDCVTVEIKYKYGLDGCTIFRLDTKDTAIIADLMMGGSGIVTDSSDIGELQLSAVGEAMNQMIGSAVTTMVSMFNNNIDITPPDVKLQKAGAALDLTDEVFGVPIVAVAFRLQVGDLIDSELVQLMSLSAAQNQVSRLMNAMEDDASQIASAFETQSTQTVAPPPPPQPMPAPAAFSAPPQAAPPPQAPVTVQPVQFASFDETHSAYGESNKNLDLLMDIGITLTVELGRTEIPIKKALELTRGSVIELNKAAGEPVELYANGKLIAKGEVVVIEDNFGLRITNIVSPVNRIKPN